MVNCSSWLLLFSKTGYWYFRILLGKILPTCKWCALVVKGYIWFGIWQGPGMGLVKLWKYCCFHWLDLCLTFTTLFIVGAAKHWRSNFFFLSSFSYWGWDELVVRGNLAVVGRILVLQIFLFLYYCVFIMQEFGGRNN